MAFLKNNQTASKPAVFKVWYKIPGSPLDLFRESSKSKQFS